MTRFSVFIEDPDSRQPYVGVAHVEVEAADEHIARSAALQIHCETTTGSFTDDDVALVAPIGADVDGPVDRGCAIEDSPYLPSTRELIDRDLVRALAHPLRVQILEALQGRIESPVRFSGRLDMDVAGANYHFKLLQKLGVIDEVANRRVRGAVEHLYTARPRSFIGHQDWRRAPLSVRGGVTDAALRSFLAKVGQAIDADTIDRREDTTLNWMPVTVDEEGWRQVARILDHVRGMLTRVAAASRERLGEADGIPVVTGLAAFEVPAGGEVGGDGA